MSRRIDLHTHSTASDGTVPPAELPRLAVEAGVTALALTDHDTVAGLDPARHAADALDLTFIPGIEISCDRGQPTGAMHILGYFIDPDADMLRQVTAELEDARRQRAPQIVDKLRELGVDLTLEDVQREAGCAMIGRPHIAQCLVARGYARTIADAFRRYVGQGAPAYVRKDNLPPQRAIAAIHAAGGLAVLAHPVQLRCEDHADLEHTIRRLIDHGLDGLEVLHTDHTPADARQYQQLAERFDLIVTGGSDFHGARKDIPIGSQPVPEQWLEPMRERLAARR